VSWQPDDRKLSDQIMTYWTNFARSGDPNGKGLPEWPRYDASSGKKVIHLDTVVQSGPDPRQPRYEFLDLYASTVRPR
jgi:para-nitrobenzyl esterase